MKQTSTRQRVHAFNCKFLRAVDPMIRKAIRASQTAGVRLGRDVQSVDVGSVEGCSGPMRRCHPSVISGASAGSGSEERRIRVDLDNYRLAAGLLDRERNSWLIVADRTPCHRWPWPDRVAQATRLR
jgi:hypothetical protein